MADHVESQKRSEIMRSVRGRNTGPERIVRSAVHRLGWRFRLHRAELAGTPDIVMAKYKTVIFVNGCFWHRHGGCAKATLPKTNKEFWERKFSGNVERDRRNYRTLKSAGWHVVVIWQCEVPNLEAAMRLLRQRLRKLLAPNASAAKWA